MKEKHETCLNLVTIGLTVFLFIIEPSTSHEVFPFNYISSLLGWMYFSAWSISFYPQIFLILQRKSCKGVSTDFILLNFIGFSAYTFYNLEYYFNHSLDVKLVALSDVVFSCHASIQCLVCLILCFLVNFEREPLSSFGLLSSVLLVIIILFSAFTLNMEEYLSVLGTVKLIVTIIKYTPQIYLNYNRKSTEGFSMHTIRLDFSGGVLSLIQLVLDAVVTSSPSIVFANPIKLGLSVLTLGFDVVYFYQHKVLYQSSSFSEEHSPLIKD